MTREFPPNPTSRGEEQLLYPAVAVVGVDHTRLASQRGKNYSDTGVGDDDEKAEEAGAFFPARIYC